jgi:hypothetical protein
LVDLLCISSRHYCAEKQTLLGQRLEEDAFCAWDLALAADDRCASHSNGNSKSLEGTLGFVVVVVTSDNIYVHCDSGTLGETLQTMRQHLGAQIAELLAVELQVGDAEGTVGQVDDSTSEGFVEGGVCVTETGETSGRLDGRLEGLVTCKHNVLLAAPP